MSDASLQIDVGPAIELLQRHQHAFKKGSRRGVVTMSRAIAISAGATTKRSKKYYSIVGKKKGHPVRRGTWYIKKVKKGGNGFDFIRVYAENKQEAKTDPKAKIVHSGLAKQSWNWVAADVGGRSTNISGLSVRKSKRFYDVKDHRNKAEPAIKLHNKLTYAEKAFRVKGKGKTVNDLGDRAARGWIKTMKREIAGVR